MFDSEWLERHFDAELYRATHADVAASGGDPFSHWIEYGREEERRGDRRNWRAPNFDSRYYLLAFPDVADLIAKGLYTSPSEHWLLSGEEEVKSGKRGALPDFDEARYLSERPDVQSAIDAQSYRSGMDHWLCIGRHEERSAISAPHVAATGTGTKGSLSDEKREFWRKNGYVILEGVISPERCDALNNRINGLWEGRDSLTLPVSIDMFIEQPTSRRVRLADAPDDARDVPYKINDLFMLDDAVQSIALDEHVCEALRWVLNCDPVAINSLNFERGSTQRFHTDTLYMPGLKPGGMTAVWFALEDAVTEAGPLLYYPGSHEIPMFKFSSGKSYQINSEVPNYDNHMQSWVEKLGLEIEEFLPKKGDALIWHEQLYHAGKQIEDLSKTRRSLVVHYWRASELPADQVIPAKGGFYLDRPPFQVSR